MGLWTLNGKLLIGPGGGLAENSACCPCNHEGPADSPCCCTNGVDTYCLPTVLYFQFTRVGDWTPADPENCTATQWATQTGELNYVGLDGNGDPEWIGFVDCGNPIGVVCYGLLAHTPADGSCDFSGAVWYCDKDSNFYLRDDNFTPYPPDNEALYLLVEDALISDCCCVGSFFNLDISSVPF